MRVKSDDRELNEFRKLEENVAELYLKRYT